MQPLLIFWHNKTQEDRESTESINNLLRSSLGRLNLLYYYAHDCSSWNRDFGIFVFWEFGIGSWFQWSVLCFRLVWLLQFWKKSFGFGKKYFGSDTDTLGRYCNRYRILVSHYSAPHPKWPYGQEIVCQFLQDHSMVAKILDFIHKQ